MSWRVTSEATATTNKQQQQLSSLGFQLHVDVQLKGVLEGAADGGVVQRGGQPQRQVLHRRLPRRQGQLLRLRRSGTMFECYQYRVLCKFYLRAAPK